MSGASNNELQGFVAYELMVVQDPPNGVDVGNPGAGDFVSYDNDRSTVIF